MDNQDRVLFQKALNEAFARKYEYELSQCHEDATYSDSHARKMESIIKNGFQPSETKASLKKRIIVGILVAAALLLAGCAAYIYRREVRQITVETYEKHAKVMFDTGSEDVDATQIEDIYCLTFVPQEYVLVDEFYSPVYNSYKWQNEQGLFLSFEQCLLDSANFMLDIECGDTLLFEYDGYNVYYRSTDTPTYIWNDGYYSFKIMSSLPLSDDTLINIIDGLQVG